MASSDEVFISKVKYLTKSLTFDILKKYIWERENNILKDLTNDASKLNLWYVDVEERLRSVINFDEFKDLIADIKNHVTIASPPKLYPKTAKDIAGRFSKDRSCIPISGGNLPDMRLDETLSTAMGNKLIKLFENNETAFHLLYAVSGAGKTRSIFEMAMHNKFFVIYMECRGSMDEDRAFLDPTHDINFAELDERITEILSLSENEFRSKAKCLIALEFTARVFYLILLLERNEGLTPRDHLLAQIGGGQTCIAMIKTYLKSFKTAELESVLRIITW
ncbi:16690_t:CDS:2 [Rhizophagus irregularis]|nr:16690_t:CDS:2 [Rhizophagus irregularis]